MSPTTYRDVQQCAARELGVKPASVKTCWIAEVKREHGLTKGPAPNGGQGRGAPPCPPRYRNAIMRCLSLYLSTSPARA